MAGVLVQTAVAQSATPEGATPEASPAASPVAGAATKSITREEFLANLKTAYKIDAPENKGGQVIYVNSSDMGTLNPIIRSDINALYVIANVFNSLITQSPVDGSIVPDLADYWEVSADGMTYTFHPNKNAAWHDGKPVTSDDVIFSFESTMNEKGNSPYRADLVATLASIKAIDAHTVELVSKKKIAVFLTKTAINVVIMPKHIWETVPVENWGAAPGSTGTDPSKVIGSGPFRFVEWVQGDHATIVRNDAYWVPEQMPTIDRFTYRVVADQNSAIQSLKTGESDICDVPSSQISTLKSDANLVVDTFDTWGWTMFIPNQDPEKGKLCTDKRVRQALMYALDRDLIVNQLLSGSGVKAEGMQPTLSRAYAPEKLTTHYGYDINRAKSLLDAAGWVDTDGDGIREKDGVKFSTDLPYSSGDAVLVQLVIYLQQSWKEIGVDVQPLELTGAPYNDRILGGDFQIAMVGIVWTDEDQGILYRGDATPEKGGFNLPRFSNPEYDKLNDEQLVEFDIKKRMELIEASNNILNENVAAGVLFFTKGATGFGKTLHNFVPNAYGGWWLAPYIWVDPR